VAVVEKPPQSCFEKSRSKPSPQTAEGWDVFDFISENRSSDFVVEEEVTVIPEGEGTTHLAIGEQSPGFILGVLGDPPKRDRPHLDSQDHAVAGTKRLASFQHFDRSPRWRQTFNRPPTFMKGKNDRWWCRDP